MRVLGQALRKRLTKKRQTWVEQQIMIKGMKLNNTQLLVEQKHKVRNHVEDSVLTFALVVEAQLTAFNIAFLIINQILSVEGYFFTEQPEMPVGFVGKAQHH